MRSVTLAGRLTIIGGGVMGLMTAYYAAPLAETVTVLERSRVGDPAAASFGLTRSVRNDYLDLEYARLAVEARRLWRELEREFGQRLLIDCGCLNLVKASVTPDLDSTYAVESYAVLERLQLPREALSGAQLRQRFPQFDADGGWLDVDAGFADLTAVTGALREGLRGPRRPGGGDLRAARDHPVRPELDRGHRFRAGGIRRAGGDRGPGDQRRARAGARLPDPLPAQPRPPDAI
jgi:glycine/D-amino acid oxidase-like deaminating enzyme